MVVVEFDARFEKTFRKIRHETVRIQLKKQIRKIIENPEVGKPMQHGRRGTRELYVAPYRLSYAWLEAHGRIILLDLYHKDVQ